MPTGGEVLARMLRAEGVDTVFGIIDGTYYGFYGALHALGIRLVTPRHEASAAHAAAAYARLTGRLGVCMASNGPGVANILPGLVVEQAEGNRVLCITSARRTGAMYPLRTGTYQGFDQAAVVGAFAKHSRAVPGFERIPELMRGALRACWDGRPGVVHLDVPENLMNGEMPGDVAYLAPSQYRRVAPTAPDAGDVARAAALLTQCELPVIHVGSGVIHAGAFDQVQRVAELLQAPVTTSWAARGAVDESSPLAIPMPHVKLNTLVRNDADAALILGRAWGRPTGGGRHRTGAGRRSNGRCKWTSTMRPSAPTGRSRSGRVPTSAPSSRRCTIACPPGATSRRLPAGARACRDMAGTSGASMPGSTPPWPIRERRCTPHTSRRRCASSSLPEARSSPTAGTLPSGPCSTAGRSRRPASSPR